MYKILDVSLGKSAMDSCYRFKFKNIEFEVQRYGANFSVPFLKDLIVNHRNQVDAIAVSDLPPIMRVQGRSFIHRQYLEVMGLPTSIPLCNGLRIKEISVINSLWELIRNGRIDPRKGIFFPLAVLHLEELYSLNEKYNPYLRFGDAYSILGIPLGIRPSFWTGPVTKAVLTMANLREIKNQTPMAKGKYAEMLRSMMMTHNHHLNFVFSDLGPLFLFGKDISMVEGREIITSFSHPMLEEDILKYRPKSIINLFPEHFRLSPFINYSVLDAVLRLAHKKTSPLSVEEWEVLLKESIEIDPETRRFFLSSRPSLQMKATRTIHNIRRRMGIGATYDFAFIVHALSQKDLFKAPGLRVLRHLPKTSRDALERMAVQIPGFTYGHIRNITSKKNSRVVNGIIYGLMATPKMMKNEEPEKTYARIEKLCDLAEESGAKIIGLGAYTKVVGDSGATISRNSPIPVTTGNSLSASATLWAVQEVVEKMKLIQRDSERNVWNCTAMVIGATGSIGKVSAKLLAGAVSKLVLVAPRMERLTELKKEIEILAPRCEITVSTNANDFAQIADVVLTATSAMDQEIIDVMRLKPGCVVCDCSRPLDFSAQDARKRPDVLIVESGEVILPGPVELTCDIGLPDDSVYACLGETAILAMEGRFESYTIGRDIDYLKVKEIFKLGQAHGVSLATIRGHAGFIGQREIELTRQLALKARRL